MKHKWANLSGQINKFLGILNRQISDKQGEFSVKIKIPPFQCSTDEILHRKHRCRGTTEFQANTDERVLTLDGFFKPTTYWKPTKIRVNVE